MTNKFIVFEGIEASGKSTQAKILKNIIEKNGGKVWLTEEPSPTYIGKLLRYYLQSGNIDTKTLGFLFAADRNEHVKEIQKHLDNGDWVICDRYVASSLAYQGIDYWNIQANKDFLMPSITIYISITPDTAMDRLKKRNGIPEMFDKKELLQKIKGRYDHLFLERRHPDILIVDGNNSLDKVTENIETNLINWTIANNIQI